MSGIVPVYIKKAITANTAAQVTTDTTIRASSVYFESDGANTANVMVGTSNVSTSSYISQLLVGKSFALGSDSSSNGSRSSERGDIQLSSLYVNAAATATVHITYLPRMGT